MESHILLSYAQRPELYANGTDIMWTDPYIAKQLLQCHIDPDNDMASRSQDKIDRIVGWILSKTNTQAMRILDLGCGPGLYAEKFAELGHRVTGVDFSQNSIEYAREHAKTTRSRNEYVCMNYLEMEYHDAFDLAIMIYLDFCVLKPGEREKVLRNIYSALKPGGLFVFDVVNSKNIEGKILRPSWEVCEKGFWKDKPYLVLNNGYHFPANKVLVNQHIVVDEEGAIKTYLFWSTYYEYEDMERLARRCDFRDLEKHENILPPSDAWNGENVDFYIIRK